MVLAIVTVLLALTVSLSTNAVSRLQSERHRDDQVELIAACESAASEAIAWMQANGSAGGLVASLPQHPEVITGYATPELQYNYINGSSFTAKLTSAAYNDPTTGMIPDLWTKTSAGVNISKVLGCAANMRNGCAVDASIVCLHTTTSGSFPDGTERYLIFASATKGDKTLDAARFQRMRVVTVVCPFPTQVFKQTMYATSAYDVGGNAGTDSYSGTTPVMSDGSTKDSPGHGDVWSATSVTKSGSSTIDGSYGQKKPPLQVSSLSYSPPSGATSLGAVSTAQNLTGNTSYRATSVASGGALTIKGPGTVTLYVDGPFNTNSIRFDDSLGKGTLVVKQGNYATSLGGTNFDLSGNALVGDVAESKKSGVTTYSSENVSTVPPDASRFQFYTGYSGDITFNGTGDLAAVLYAPQANIKMNGTFQFFGAIVADGFSGKVNGTFNFHYDDRLGNMLLPLSPQFSTTGWNVYNVAINQN
jgi:hypothetical protein